MNNSIELKPNIQTLQKDAIYLLDDIGKLFLEASLIFGAGASAEKFSQSKAVVDDAKVNVRSLELRMAIVAPMKAGKSTIINAVVGQELLPSRNAAMTTLPTEIILDSTLGEPELILDDEIRTIFQTSVSVLQNVSEDAGIDSVKERLSQYPHLHPLIEEISSGGFDIPEKIEGREPIIKALSDLNDTIRLCSIFAPEADPLSGLSTVPRVKTPFWNQQDSSQSDLLGNLVIIDTPGPNEAGENLRLSGVVEDELKKSSIVLIVLDFTQLKTKAAEKVKQDVKRVIELRGRDSLYILVNKADQRRDGDMSTEEVQDFVASEFGLDPLKSSSTVFEVSARRAFSASSFFKSESLLDLEPSHDELNEFKALRSVRLLAEEVFGIDWEEDLEYSDLDELNRKAGRLLKKSKFDTFIEEAIYALMQSAAPRTIRSALNLSKGMLIELKDESSLRDKAISKGAAKLKQEVLCLEEDLNHLELCKKRLEKVKEIKQPLKAYLDNTLSTIKEDIKLAIRQKFVDEDYDRGNVLKKFDIYARNLFAHLVLNTVTSSEGPLSKLAYKTKGVVEFDSKAEAELFSNKSTAFCKRLVENYLLQFKQLFEERLQVKYVELRSALKSEAEPIIRRATERLSKEFDVQLTKFSPPTISTEACGEIDFRETKRVRQYKETETQKRRRWFVLWMIKVNTKVKIDKSEDYYVVVLEDLVAQVNQSLDQNIEEISANIMKYLNEDIQVQMDIYFNSLDRFLSGYRESLKNAQLDQELSMNEQDELKKKLKLIAEKSIKKSQKCEKYLARLASVVS